jgi:hypothetical protein
MLNRRGCHPRFDLALPTAAVDAMVTELMEPDE